MSDRCVCLQHGSTHEGHYGSAHVQDAAASHLQVSVAACGVFAGENVPGMLMTFSGPT